jgi:PAS domain-containing protein
MSPATISLVSLALNLVLGGGLLAVWLKYRVQMRSADRMDFDTILEAVETQRNEERTLGKERDQKITNLEAEIHGLRIARDLDPFPNWVVDLQGCFKYVNREFETVFLEPAKQTYRDIIGKRYPDLWPEEFCRTVEALGSAASKRPDGTARANTALDVPRIGTAAVTVHKFPVRFKGAIVAFAGYITAIEAEAQRLGT